MIGDFEQQRVKLSTGIELDVVDIGPRDAPALIFLHGFPESHRTWRYQLPHFATRYRCIAPDQRGYGRTIGWGDSYDADLRPFSDPGSCRLRLASATTARRP